jgi:hypothetical protein
VVIRLCSRTALSIFAVAFCNGKERRRFLQGGLLARIRTALEGCCWDSRLLLELMLNIRMPPTCM